MLGYLENLENSMKSTEFINLFIVFLFNRTKAESNWMEAIAIINNTVFYCILLLGFSLTK